MAWWKKRGKTKRMAGSTTENRKGTRGRNCDGLRARNGAFGTCVPWGSHAILPLSSFTFPFFHAFPVGLWLRSTPRAHRNFSPSRRILAKRTTAIPGGPNGRSHFSVRCRFRRKDASYRVFPVLGASSPHISFFVFVLFLSVLLYWIVGLLFELAVNCIAYIGRGFSALQRIDLRHPLDPVYFFSRP
jgi:hypothetical protein